MALRRTGMRAYVMRHCDVCARPTPHTPKGKCVTCDQRAKATTPGRRVYQQGKALLRAKKAAGKRPSRQVSPTMQAAGAALSLAKARARKRAGGLCEACGFPCKIGHGHHRRPQQAGGSSSLEVQSAANIIWIHPECHEHIESFRTRSYELGLLVYQSIDPAKRRVLLHNGWHLLADDGSMTRVSPPDEEASSDVVQGG